METKGLEITIIRTSSHRLTNTDDPTQSEFFKMLEHLRQSPVNSIIALDGVMHINDSFMTALYAAMAACRRNNSRLVICCNPTSRVAMLIKSILWASALPQYPNIEAATASFR